MKRIWLLHVAIVGLILLCAFSPWIFLAAVTLANAESLEGLALGAGYIGMGLTPLGLLVAMIYMVAAVIYHFVATRRFGATPISLGKYLLVWLGIMVVGVIIGWILLSAPQAVRRSAEQPPQADCSSLVREPVTSDLSNGLLAMGWRYLNSASSTKKDGFLLLGANGVLEQRLELEHKVYGLAWAPDGEQVVFSNESNLFVMDADGGNLHQVPLPNADQERRLEKPAWSQDGGLIFFPWQVADSTTPDLEIFAVQPDGSGLRQLTDAAASSFAPALSPNGKQIVFVSNRDGNNKLYLMNIDGSDQQVLAGDAAQASSPAWSPDGRWIVFLSDQTGSWAIHITAVDGSGSCLLASPEQKVSAPVWSPDGDWIYFIRAMGTLMAIRPDSQDLRFVYQNTSFTVLYSPAWKPGEH
jgi:Tol biopolymer transport system component